MELFSDFCRNIVANVNLNCQLNLKRIALHARNTEYNPRVSTHLDSKESLSSVSETQLSSRRIVSRSEGFPPTQLHFSSFSLIFFAQISNFFQRFPAVIMRLRFPKTTALIFSSGKMVCMGAKDENESKIAARKFARIILKLNFPVSFTNFRIKNIVGSCDVKFRIDLELVYRRHNEHCSVSLSRFKPKV